MRYMFWPRRCGLISRNNRQVMNDGPVANHGDPGQGNTRTKNEQPANQEEEKDDHSESDNSNEDGGLAKLLAGLGPEECYEILEVSDGGVRKLESLPEKSARPSHKRAFILRRKTTEQKAREAAVFTNSGKV